MVTSSGYLADSSFTYFANINPGHSPDIAYFYNASHIAGNWYEYYTCDVAGGVLQCTASGPTNFGVCGGVVFEAPTGSINPCADFSFAGMLMC